MIPVIKCPLTHWGRVTHICVSKLTIIGSDNGLSPDRRQAIILTNAGLLLIRPLGTNFSEILIEILTFSFKKMRLKVSSAKRRPFCLGLNALICHVQIGYNFSLGTDVLAHSRQNGHHLAEDICGLIFFIKLHCRFFLINNKTAWVLYNWHASIWTIYWYIHHWVSLS